MTVVSRVKGFVDSYELGIYNTAELAGILNANKNTVSTALMINGAEKKKTVNAVSCLIGRGFTLDSALSTIGTTMDKYMVLVNIEKRRIKNEEEKKQKV